MTSNCLPPLAGSAQTCEHVQAWADNLLLTGRKGGLPLDRRRDGSQESCTTIALHALQQELGMPRKPQGERCNARTTAPSFHAGHFGYGRAQFLDVKSIEVPQWPAAGN